MISPITSNDYRADNTPPPSNTPPGSDNFNPNGTDLDKSLQMIMALLQKMLGDTSGDDDKTPKTPPSAGDNTTPDKKDGDGKSPSGDESGFIVADTGDGNSAPDMGDDYDHGPGAIIEDLTGPDVKETIVEETDLTAV